LIAEWCDALIVGSHVGYGGCERFPCRSHAQVTVAKFKIFSTRENASKIAAFERSGKCCAEESRASTMPSVMPSQVVLVIEKLFSHVTRNTPGDGLIHSGQLDILQGIVNLELEPNSLTCVYADGTPE
jgi:hypothetical protein